MENNEKRKPNIYMSLSTAPEYGFKENKDSYIISLDGETYPVKEDIKNSDFRGVRLQKNG